MPRIVDVGSCKVGDSFFVIAGPCVIESAELCHAVAERLVAVTKAMDVPYVFKSSYDKANRTSGASFRGPGLKEGLEILRSVREKYGCPVLTDVHTPAEAEQAGESVDAVQIPAFLSRQTDLLLAAGRTGRAVNVKKGQFLAPWDVRGAIDKIKSTDNDQILITERGTSFGYNNLVVDMRSVPAMKRFGYPVVIDGSHSAQLPGAGGSASGGDRGMIAPLVRAAVAAGCDGVFLEVHTAPEKALCDGPNMLVLDEAEELLRTTLSIHEVVHDRI